MQVSSTLLVARSVFKRTVGLPGRMVSSSQGLSLHRTTQRGETKDKHSCSKRDTNTRSSVGMLKVLALDSAAAGSAALYSNLM